MNRERLKGNLDLLLLSVLAAGPAHGYAIIASLRERSEGAFDLPEGTIYPALHRLENAGLLASSWAQTDGRRRRVYALSTEGVGALAAQRTEWRAFAAGMRAVLGGVEWRGMRPVAGGQSPAGLA
jgi:DNA-binding PadR family transcriptional regulator